MDTRSRRKRNLVMIVMLTKILMEIGTIVIRKKERKIAKCVTGCLMGFIYTTADSNPPLAP